MDQRTDFIGALVPQAGGAGAPPSDLFGLALAALLAQGASGGAQWLQSDQGRDLVARLKQKAGDDEARFKALWVRCRRRAARAGDAKSRQKWARKSARYQERYELARARSRFAERGVGGRDPTAQGMIKEHRRNALAAEWSSASPARRGQIKELVGAYDQALVKLKREAASLKPRVGGQEARQVYRPRRLPFTANQALVNGLGGLQFNAQSPPGAARLCRLPLYPLNNLDSMSGAGGIIEPGDDPVLLMQLTPPPAVPGAGVGVFVQGRPHTVVTRPLEYGQYRVIGIQCSLQENYVPKCTTALFQAQTLDSANNLTSVMGVGVSVRSLIVHNGAEILLPLGDLDARSFQMLRSDAVYGVGVAAPLLVGWVPGQVFHQQAPFNDKIRLSGLFMGLRDYPVLDTDAHLRMKVQAFASNVLDGDNNGNGPYTLPIPATFHLVCEILTDNVYGDNRNPSPAGRAGALVKVGSETSINPLTKEQRYRLKSARWRRPE
jgi:hypothetical protein